MQKLKKPKKAFEYALEEEISKNPQYAKEICSKATSAVRDIKSMQRKGTTAAEAKTLKTLEQGYAALNNVVSKISKSTKRG